MTRAPAGAFRVDLADPRFREMFTSHHFALDPTDPRYTRTEATQASAPACLLACLLACCSCCLLPALLLLRMDGVLLGGWPLG